MSEATIYGAHGHYCEHEECGGAVYVCPQITHCRRPRNHPCPDHDPSLAQAAERLTAPNVDEQIELVRALAAERDALRAQVEELRQVIFGLVPEDWLDGSMDHMPGLRRARAALEKKP